MNISVICLLYNPDWVRTERTLRSIVEQEGCEWELILADDGSTKDCWAEIEQFLATYLPSTVQVIYVKNEKNQGTVKNYLSALERATGEYVYAISPGDMLYDKFTIKKFYEFAVENDSDVVFGGAIYYNPISESICDAFVGYPQAPDLYRKNTSTKLRRTAFFAGELINGASYFRKREIALESFRFIQPYAKYVEDTTSSFYILASGHDIIYCPENIIFYEYNTGISTTANGFWKQIQQDIVATREAVASVFSRRQFPVSIVEQVAYTGGGYSKYWYMITHPYATLQRIRIKLLSKKHRKQITNRELLTAQLKIKLHGQQKEAVCK